MGLFTKKYTPDQILELINDLPEEERSELKANIRAGAGGDRSGRNTY